jgi:hypothetical protein
MARTRHSYASRRLSKATSVAITRVLRNAAIAHGAESAFIGRPWIASIYPRGRRGAVIQSIASGIYQDDSAQAAVAVFLDDAAQRTENIGKRIAAGLHLKQPIFSREQRLGPL